MGKYTTVWGLLILKVKSSPCRTKTADKEQELEFQQSHKTRLMEMSELNSAVTGIMELQKELRSSARWTQVERAH